MYLAIQPQLMERAVFETARQDPSFRSHYERQFADCYEHRQTHRCDQAFSEMHERWFMELGFRDLIAGLVKECPNFSRAVDRLMVTQAPNPRGQSVELFGAAGSYTVVAAISVAILIDRPAFQYWARHEFLHIDDMLNPAFGYDTTQKISGPTIAARNLLQDRYAVLWALSVDARLAKRELIPAGIREKRLAELVRSFRIQNLAESNSVFEDLWNRPHPPDNAALLTWARRGFPSDGRQDPDANDQPMPGAPCALCGFPTFDWATNKDLARVEQYILEDFPDWSARCPVCGRCAEVYLTRNRAVST